MDAKLVITSFDELRKLIIEQFKNLSKQMESAKSTLHEQALPTVNASQIKELIRNIPQPDISNLEHSQEQLHAIADKLDNRQSTPLPPQKHLHTVELKSSKVVIALVSLGVTSLCSISYNIYQFSANNRLSDND